MPGFSSLLNHRVERSLRLRCGVVVLLFCRVAKVFSRSCVRLRRASSSLSQSSMFGGGLLEQEQPVQKAWVSHGIGIFGPVIFLFFSLF